MTPLISSAERATLLAALEANFAAYYLAYSTLPGGTSHDAGALRRYRVLDRDGIDPIDSRCKFLRHGGHRLLASTPAPLCIAAAGERGLSLARCGDLHLARQR